MEVAQKLPGSKSPASSWDVQDEVLHRDEGLLLRTGLVRARQGLRALRAQCPETLKC